jgi:hypothetical protein
VPLSRKTTPSTETTNSRRKPASTPQGREIQMISLAERLAENQLRDGSASAQVITHYLKLGSSREQIEQKRLEGEVELQKAKIESMASTQRLEEMYSKAMQAFRGYQGNPPEEEEDRE